MLSLYRLLLCSSVLSCVTSLHGYYAFADVAFLVDDAADGYGLPRDLDYWARCVIPFVSSVIIQVTGTLGLPNSRFAFIKYANDADFEFHFDTYPDLEELLSAVDNITSQGRGLSNMTDALVLARTELFDSSLPGYRSNAVQIAVVLTENLNKASMSDHWSSIHSANSALIANGVKINAVMRESSNFPLLSDYQHIYTIASYSSLDEIAVNWLAQTIYNDSLNGFSSESIGTIFEPFDVLNTSKKPLVLDTSQVLFVLTTPTVFVSTFSQQLWTYGESNNIAIGVGIGVGLGVPVIFAVMVLFFVFHVKKRTKLMGGSMGGIARIVQHKSSKSADIDQSEAGAVAYENHCYTRRMSIGLQTTNSSAIQRDGSVTDAGRYSSIGEMQPEWAATGTVSLRPPSQSSRPNRTDAPHNEPYFPTNDDVTERYGNLQISRASPHYGNVFPHSGMDVSRYVRPTMDDSDYMNPIVTEYSTNEGPVYENADQLIILQSNEGLTRHEYSIP